MVGEKLSFLIYEWMGDLRDERLVTTINKEEDNGKILDVYACIKLF